MDNRSEKMPVLFIGHGNPMNALEENEFTLKMKNLAENLPRPKAILCISAHWQSRGSLVTAMKQPPTIHDFGGFPDELHRVQYHAPGSEALASRIKDLIPNVSADMNWGLDHGCWTILKHMYPLADIPVVELSMDLGLTSQEHFNLAQNLTPLREEGILIIGSGNLIHNLRLVDWKNIDTIGFGHSWAVIAQQQINGLILKRDMKSLIHYREMGTEINLAAPTPDHFLPLLYVMATMNESDTLKLFNDQLIAGSLSMTSVLITPDAGDIPNI